MREPAHHRIRFRQVRNPMASGEVLDDLDLDIAAG